MNSTFADLAMTPHQKKTAERLRASTLTPGFYKPTEPVMQATHCTVVVGGTHVIALGPKECPYSREQANALAASDRLKQALSILEIEGEMFSGSLEGSHIDWPETCAGVVVKKSGEIVEATPMDKPLLGDLNTIILLPTEKGQALASLLCTDNEILHILDPWAPSLPE